MNDKIKYTSELKEIICRPDFAHNKNQQRLKSKLTQRRQRPKTHNTRVMVLVAKIKQWRGGVCVIVLWMASRL